MVSGLIKTTRGFDIFLLLMAEKSAVGGTVISLSAFKFEMKSL